MNRHWKLNIKASSIWTAFLSKTVLPNKKFNIYPSLYLLYPIVPIQIIFNSLYKGGAEKFLAQCIKNKIVFENLVIKILILSSVSGE